MGQGITLGDLKGTIEAFLHALFGAAVPGALPAVVLPVHRAVGRGRPRLRGLRRQGLPRVQEHGLAGDHGLGDGAPGRVRGVNARLGRVVYDPEQVTGFAFGLGIERVAMVRHGDRRHPPLLRERPALPGAVPAMKVPLSLAAGVRGLPGGAARAWPRTSRWPAWRWTASRTRGDDAVLDLDITTNRVDCMNVYGVAREVVGPLRRAAAAARRRLRRRRARPRPRPGRSTIEAPDLCPRFCGRVLDVRIGPSPAWMRDAPGGGRRAADQQRGRPHQLRDDRDGPAVPRLRPGARSRAARSSCAGRGAGER